MITDIIGTEFWNQIKSQCRSKAERPDFPSIWEGALNIDTKSSDGVKLSGWAWQNPCARKGTIVVAHGFTENCVRDSVSGLASHSVHKHGLSICAVDFRMHGRSGDRLPTFGQMEAEDLKACITAALAMGLPGPFYLIGTSLGAMASQLLAMTDERVAGAACIAPPGWPMDAVGKVATTIRQQSPLFFLPGISELAMIITARGVISNSYGGRDVLSEGDIRRYHPTPSHSPTMLYVIGAKDSYDPTKCEQVFNSIYPMQRAASGEWPSKATWAQAWYICVPDHTHPGQGDPQILDWKNLLILIDDWLSVTIQKQSDRKRILK